MINYKKLTAAMAAGIIAIFTITGCAMPWQKAADDSSSNVSTVSAGNLSQSGENAQSLEFDSEDLDSSYNESECTKINLSGSGATVSGSGVTVENGNITITSAGSYIISGTLTDGSIKVNCSEKGTVRLILNGASISSSSTAPVVVEEAKKVLVTLADGTTNTITDKTRQSVDDEDFSSAVYSKADLVFNGSGTLNVNAGYRNGIKSTDDLKVVSGTFNITSNEDGIIGKDLLGIKDGKFTIKSGSDGMKSTYDTDTSKGNIVITGGEFDITASNDGIHCNEDILISGGNLTISSGDDGVHADDNLQVDGGTIDIKKCCEGLEGSTAINVSRLLKLLRYCSEELSYHKYVKTVFKSHTAGAHKIIRKCRASEVDCLSRRCLDNSKDIKVSEMQMQGCRNRLWRNDDHKYYTCKPELLEREIESGKAISDNRTYSYL